MSGAHDADDNAHNNVNGGSKSKHGDGNDDEDDDEDGEAGDMEEFEESGQLEMVDPCTATIVRAPAATVASSNAANVAAALEADGDSVVRTRTYDLHITYDKYYQTPRLWVVGYNEVSFWNSIGVMEKLYLIKPVRLVRTAKR